MKAEKPRQYRSLNEFIEQRKDAGPAADRYSEFPLGAMAPFEISLDAVSRRRFLSLLSASTALALGSSACSRIDRGTIVPYTKKPDEIIPGVAAYYASTFQEGLVTHGVLVKTREGRPIHVEGNGDHPLSRGKTSLRSIADVLGLYDPDRLRRPMKDGSPVAWDEAFREIGQILRDARDGSRPVLLVTEAVISPSRRALIEDLKKSLHSMRHVAWEPAMPQPEILAARALYGEALLPRLRFDRADVILALQSDFLGTNGDAPALIQDFASRRSTSRPTDGMNRLWVMEGVMSLTGANADQRMQVRPTKIAPLIFALARVLNESHGVPLPAGLSVESLRAFSLEALATDAALDQALLEMLAVDLRRAGKSALVVAGPSVPYEAHLACGLLNAMLGAEGHTVDASLSLPAADLLTYAGMRDLLKEASQGTFAAAVFWGSNPAYSFPDSTLWQSAVAKIPVGIRVGLYEDETALDCRWRLPEHHWLEAWGDFEPAADLLSLRQPTLGAIHNTRQGEDILLSWLRALGADLPFTYGDYLKARWQKEVYPAGNPASFGDFWNAALHDGVVGRDAKPRPPRAIRPEACVAAAAGLSGGKPAAPGEVELALAPAAGVYDGRYANNGWLNELPDPVTKATWCNPLLLSVADAARLGLKDEDVVRITAGSAIVEAPVVIQPGQARNVAGLSLGYGRRTGNVGAGIGANASVLMDIASNAPQLRAAIKIEKTGRRALVARTQEHWSMQGRDPARSWTPSEYARATAQPASEKKPEHISLIPGHSFPDMKWGMAIDLSACVGCSACVIACQSENNIPVVGAERVARSREMHWIRVDRYYEGDPADPAVIHQPLPCQHCDDAPCEIVCPVNATTHSADGLNQMAYNRCVGTRYCSNNCPYKVRRFNFFEYNAMKKDPETLVFNPEVTVRPRGVMEKCSFCIQRIENAKLNAKVQGRAIRDGEVEPACAAACPAQAIVFGDLHDPKSKISRVSRMNRGYHLLEELGVKPAVTYLVDISNPARGKSQA